MPRPHRIYLLALLALAPACREGAEAPAAVETSDRAIDFTGDADLILEYLDLAGRLHQARGVAAIPAASRQVVRVIDPEAPRRTDGRVHVADVSAPDAGGRYHSELVTVHLFRARALAALPPGEASRVVLPVAFDGPGELPTHDRIIVYGTSWCAACKQLREYLRARRITFEDRNVENDPGAAEELAVKAAAVGVITDRVPIIDVRGLLLVGYDPQRLDEILGASA